MTRVRCSALLLALALPIHAATITSGQPTPLAEGKSEVHVVFEPGPGESVSGLQFEITFDPAHTSIDEIQPGPTSTAGGKMVSFNKVANGRCRVIIAGFNQNVLEKGTLAILRLSHPAAGPNFALLNPVLSDPKGQAVRGTATGLQVTAPGNSTDTPPPDARRACACAPGPKPDYRGDVLVLFLCAATLVLARRGTPKLSPAPPAGTQ